MDESIDAWDNRMPAALEAHVDFVSSMVIVLLAFVLRRLGMIKSDHIPGMQALTFTLCLPALVLGVMWTVEIDAKLLSVFAVASLTHTFWATTTALASRCAAAEHRGLYSMATTGGALAFVYPVLLQSSRFGPEAAAVVVMWELGGNLLVVTLVHGLAASAYAPVPALEAQSLGASTAVGLPATLRARGPNLPVVVGMPAEESTPDVEAEEGAGTRSTVDVRAHLCAVGVQVARTPLIWAAVAGLLLNVLRVPVYPLPAKAVQALAVAFPPLLYAFIGANLRLNLGRAAYGTVTRVLFARLVSCVVIGMLVWFVLPLSPEVRGICVLCVTAPIATTFCMYTSTYGYPMDQAVMIYNVSALASIIIMGLLVDVV